MRHHVGKMYYLDCGKIMMKDLQEFIDNGIKINVGYDGDVKLWWIRVK